MNLVLVTALIAVCGADKLDRSYLPPASANTAGGSPGSLQTPFKTFNQGLGGLPKGGYNNEFEGVVVDASAPGTRASGADDTGLGGPRIAYGSLDSKVGDAAFTADTAFPRVGVNSGLNTQVFRNPQSHGAQPQRIQSFRDRVSNTVRYENDVSPDRFNYAFETDNGIVAEENGVEVNGVKAQGGYSYTGDDGQVYSVTYTADEEGYRPKGDHLPTPPPIPAEILESLEKNAQDEAAGIVDDGSYDAQKYNTGEDYTKTDNGQYNIGQPIQLGNRPQSDAVASGSFINQNNQGFVRPNSQQFASTFSQDSSKNEPSNGNNFGLAGGADKQVQNKQTFGFGVTSNNEYLPPSNSFNSNRRPSLNGPHGTQSDVQIPSYSSNGFNKNQNTETPAFIPLSQQNLQGDGSKRPHSSSPIFGKPTVIDSTLSIKDPFAKRPSSNRFNQNKQPNERPQPIGGSFEVVSGNVYSSKNEYLPPRRQGQANKPNQNNGNQRFQGTNSGSQTNQQFINSQPFNSNSPSASAFASVSRPSLELQSSQQYNGQQIPQSLSTNPSGNNVFNQISQNYNNRPSNEQQPSLSSSRPNVPNFNGSPVNQFQYRPSTFASQSPTLTPQSELSTSIGSNSNGNKNIAPVPVIDGPDSPSQPGSSGLHSFGTQPSSSFDAQYGFNSNKFQQASPTQPSTSVVSTLSDQSNAAQSGRPQGNLGSQSQSSKLPVNGQYSFSTQRPSFNQYNQQQGADDSYYYNTPSKPFNAPTPRPQGSIFPSTSFDQSFNQTPFGSKPQLSGNSGTFFTPQGNTPSDDGRYPKPSTIGSIAPTQPTQQGEQNDNKFQTQFNKVTQASSSSFPSPTPSTSAGLNGNQFDTRPSQPVDRLNQGTQSFNQKESSSRPQQQYGGEIYEYNKPPQTLPTPQNSASSGQFGQTSQFGTPSNTPASQSQAPGIYRPSSQFGSKFTQQPFGQRPLNSQVSQDNQAFNINNPGQTQQKPGPFGSQQNPNQNSQPIQGASKFPPTYNQPAPPCCKQLAPSQTSQADKQDGTSQLSNQFSQQGSDQGVKPVQSVSTFAGVGESFGGNRKPPSFDSNGYHY